MDIINIEDDESSLPVETENEATECVEIKEAQKSNPRKRSCQEMESDAAELEKDREEGLLCPVCLDAWTSTGPHRLCSLKCGHLFGLSCVQRWLEGKSKCCPSCNAKAKRADIREIYASKLVVVDTSELDELRRQCVKLQNDNQDLQKQLSLQKTLVAYYKEQLEKAPEESVIAVKKSLNVLQVFSPRALFSLRLEEGLCRVLSYCYPRSTLAISQEHVGPLWPGFGIRLLSTSTSQISPHQPLHKKELRDLCFHSTNPDLLLSVAFDNQVKIFDLSCNKVVFSWTAEHRIWSCCWDSENTWQVYVGTERGRVVCLDALAGASLGELPMPLELVKPVAVISLKVSRRLRCLLCCRLLSLSAYSLNGDISQCNLQVLEEGKISAMAFTEDDSTSTLVLTIKPNTGSNRIHHVCYRLESEDEKVNLIQLHVLLGGEQSQQISRSCLLPTTAGIVFFAFCEHQSDVCGWFLGQEKKAVAIKTHSVVRDLVAVQQDSKFILFILTKNLLKSYQLV